MFTFLQLIFKLKNILILTHKIQLEKISNFDYFNEKFFSTDFGVKLSSPNSGLAKSIV